MKRLALALVCVAGCGSAVSANVVSLPPAPSASVAASPQITIAPAMHVVVTGAPYGALALWRTYATGRIEAIAFPWAQLSIIDSLVVSPDGSEVAYVEGGSAFGPLVVRSLADGTKTVIDAHVAGGEHLVIAWSPDGRNLLYATRRAGQLRPDCHRSGCPGAGPSSYFVFDRANHSATNIVVPGELAAWLAPPLGNGDVIVADDDGALARASHGKKTPVADGAYRHDDFSLDAASHRLLSTGWNDATQRSEVLALDLTTCTESAVAPPAPYATYHWPSASPSGRRVAWLATSFANRRLAEGLVVDGRAIIAPTRELVGFAWIDDRTLVAHYEDRIDVVAAADGAVKGSKTTNAQDMMP
ncbi:MAG TPA: hypothetical protein VGH87_21855 [Polyangiaceae bacterium]|jgi:hypothetical protein